MKTNVYNSMMRDFVNMANAANRTRAMLPYDYARNGGSVMPTNGYAKAERARVLPINAWAEDDVYFVVANLPGVNPEDVEITFEGDDLTIRGEFPSMQKSDSEGSEEEDAEKVEEEKIHFIRHELYSGAFERKIGFNVPVDADNIEAVFEKGLLKLSIPKAEEAKPKQIKVLAK